MPTEAMATKAQQDMAARAQAPASGRPTPQQLQPALQGGALQQMRGSPALAGQQVHQISPRTWSIPRSVLKFTCIWQLHWITTCI